MPSPPPSPPPPPPPSTAAGVRPPDPGVRPPDPIAPVATTCHRRSSTSPAGGATAASPSRPPAATNAGRRPPGGLPLSPPATEQQQWFDFREIYEMGELSLVGGVDFIYRSTALFDDLTLRRILNSDERCQAYLQFREEASQIAATELVSSYNSPRSIIGNDENNGCGVDNISKLFHLTEENIQHHKNNKRALLQKVVQTRRYFAYRKGLVKLDFIQSNSDLEYVLGRLKSSSICSELDGHKRRLGLESHMKLLKEMEKTRCSSMSEYENLALEKINLELGSKLQGHLESSYWRRMHQYYNCKKMMSLARECAAQAEATGFILCEDALPVRSMEQIAGNSEANVLPFVKQPVKQSYDSSLAKRLPFTKQTMTQALEGSMRRINEKFQGGRARGRAWQLVAAATAATLASAGLSNKRNG